MDEEDEALYGSAGADESSNVAIGMGGADGGADGEEELAIDMGGEGEEEGGEDGDGDGDDDGVDVIIDQDDLVTSPRAGAAGGWGGGVQVCYRLLIPL